LGVGEALRFLHEVDLINQRRRQRVVQLAAELLDRTNGPAGPDLGGAAGSPYWARRSSPTPMTYGTRRRCRWYASCPVPAATVAVYDPEGMVNAERELPEVGFAKTLADAVAGADLLCVLTEWEEFRNADPVALGELVSGKRVIDGRNCLDQALWVRAGWQYPRTGSPDSSLIRPFPPLAGSDDHSASFA